MWWDRKDAILKLLMLCCHICQQSFKNTELGVLGCLNTNEVKHTRLTNRVPKESSNVVSVNSISFTNNTMACEIWSTHNNVAYDPRLLGCGTVSLSDCFPKFWRIIVPSSSGSVQELLELLDPEDEGTTILQNAGNYSPNNTVLHPTRWKSST
jgi:hypothetical protein